MVYFSEFEPPKKTWLQRFTEQPHQLFFISTIFFAFVTMIGTFLSLLGKEVDFTLFHSFGVMFGVFTNAFLGFLITVIPKYSTSQPIEKKSYISLWVSYQIGLLVALLGFAMVGKLVIVGTLLYMAKVFYLIIDKGYSTDKKESYILTFLVLLGALLLLGEVVFQKDLSVLIFFGYLLNIVFLVALKMVPSFYSIYTQKPKWQKPKYTLEISLILLFGMGVVGQFEIFFLGKIVAFLALIFFGYIVFHLDIYTKTPPIISILVVSFFWFFIGVILYFVEMSLELYTMKLSFHIFALGFVLNLLIGFGSRVTMGHAIPSQKIVADNFTIGLFVLMQVVIISRILGSILYLGEYNFFMGFFHLSITLWILLFLGWSLRYGRTLLRI